MDFIPLPWQDVIFTSGNIIFALSLLGTVLHEDAGIPRITSIPTAFFLYLFVISFWSLGLIFSAVTSGISAFLWTFIALFRST